MTKSNTFSRTFNVQSGAIKYLEHVVLTVSFGIKTVSLYLVLSSHILSLLIFMLLLVFIALYSCSLKFIESISLLHS